MCNFHHHMAVATTYHPSHLWVKRIFYPLTWIEFKILILISSWIQFRIWIGISSSDSILGLIFDFCRAKILIVRVKIRFLGLKLAFDSISIKKWVKSVLTVYSLNYYDHDSTRIQNSFEYKLNSNQIQIRFEFPNFAKIRIQLNLIS